MSCDAIIPTQAIPCSEEQITEALICGAASTCTESSIDVGDFTAESNSGLANYADFYIHTNGDVYFISSRYRHYLFIYRASSGLIDKRHIPTEAFGNSSFTAYGAFQKIVPYTYVYDGVSYPSLWFMSAGAATISECQIIFYDFNSDTLGSGYVLAGATTVNTTTSRQSITAGVYHIYPPDATHNYAIVLNMETGDISTVTWAGWVTNRFTPVSAFKIDNNTVVWFNSNQSTASNVIDRFGLKFNAQTGVFTKINYPATKPTNTASATLQTNRTGDPSWYRGVINGKIYFCSNLATSTSAKVIYEYDVNTNAIATYTIPPSILLSYVTPNTVNLEIFYYEGLIRIPTYDTTKITGAYLSHLTFDTVTKNIGYVNYGYPTSHSGVTAGFSSGLSLQSLRGDELWVFVSAQVQDDDYTVTPKTTEHGIYVYELGTGTFKRQLPHTRVANKIGTVITSQRSMTLAAAWDSVNDKYYFAPNFVPSLRVIQACPEGSEEIEDEIPEAIQCQESVINSVTSCASETISEATEEPACIEIINEPNVGAGIPETTITYSGSHTLTKSCPEGLVGDPVSVTGYGYSTISQANADAQAYADAAYKITTVEPVCTFIPCQDFLLYRNSNVTIPYATYTVFQNFNGVSTCFWSPKALFPYESSSGPVLPYSPHSRNPVRIVDLTGTKTHLCIRATPEANGASGNFNFGMPRFDSYMDVFGTPVSPINFSDCSGDSTVYSRTYFPNGNDFLIPLVNGEIQLNLWDGCKVVCGIGEYSTSQSAKDGLFGLVTV